MKTAHHTIWFPVKKYGYGWGLPVAWQGWVVLASYILLLMLGGLFLRTSPFLIAPLVLYVFVLTGVLLYICWKKGEKPRLRLGKDVS
jgi:hypothetical protein